MTLSLLSTACALLACIIGSCNGYSRPIQNFGLPMWADIAMHCPWEKLALQNWSDTATWPSGKVPVEGDEVIITAGHRVLLDVQPAALTSLTIEHEAALHWGNVSDLVLETEFILVKGEFSMGSHTCRLEVPATIRLTGQINSTVFVSDEFDAEIRKVIMVTEGGMVEIHGMEKTPWTHLAQTIKPVATYPCAFVYDHADPKTNPWALERGKGLHVIVWNEDATLFDFIIFQDSFTPMKEFIDGVPDGKVIGMYVFGDGICCRRMRSMDFPTLDDVIVNDLGGKLIKKIDKDDSYSLLTRKGMQNLTQEHWIPGGRNLKVVDKVEKFLQLPVWEHKLDFQVATNPKTNYQYFRVLQADTAYPILELAKPVVGWLPGDKILVTSTDYDWEQLEIREVIDCHGGCSDSQVRVNETFRYIHYGNFTYDIDERAEVAILSRNILIEGEMQKKCFSEDRTIFKRCKRFGGDTFGGHIRILRGHRYCHIQGAELYHMGQQGIMGSYPLHFHMCDEAPGSWFRDNSIHHSFQRCVTIHGTDKVEVSGNVCYDHLGHGFFLEDSVEQNNVIRGNLAVATRNGATLMSDSTKVWCNEDYPIKKGFEVNCDEVSAFWITHPNNIIRDNVAAGGVGHGYMFVFSRMPLGLSFERQKELKRVLNDSVRHTPINSFYNNRAHSYARSGVFIDSVIATGRMTFENGVPENGILQEENLYDPRSPAGDPNGKRVWDSKLERITTYKNVQNNMWVKGGNINVTFCSLADSASQSFSGGTTGFWTGVSVEYSVFVGKTENLGEPRLYNEVAPNGVPLVNQFKGSIGASPWFTVTGVGIYQGPMFIKHTYFNKFETVYWNNTWAKKKLLGVRPASYAAAVSFKKDSTYPTYTSQYTTNLTFGFCDNKKNRMHRLWFGDPHKVGDWQDLDGTKAAHNLDKDGSLTGTPNTYIVRDRPFFAGPECTSRKDWDMTVCPYRYVKFELLGKGGVLDTHKESWPLIGHRDNAPKDPYYQQGQQRREYLARTYTSYLIDVNTSIPNAEFYNDIKIQGNGVEKKDMVRVGICVPLDLQDFEVRSTYPIIINRNNYTKANSLAELDRTKNDTVVFHDTVNGIIFFKIWSLHDRTNDSQLCPAGLCFNIRFTLNAGNYTARSCFGNSEYEPYVDKRKQPKKVVKADNCAHKGSARGIGAVRWDEVGRIVLDDFKVKCRKVTKIERKRPQYQGCFVAEFQPFTLPQKWGKSMTIDHCALRCYQRNYLYAGLMQSSICMCGQSVDRSEPAMRIKDRLCDLPCAGKPDTECGNGNRLSIWTTGYVAPETTTTMATASTIAL